MFNYFGGLLERMGCFQDHMMRDAHNITTAGRATFI